MIRILYAHFKKKLLGDEELQIAPNNQSEKIPVTIIKQEVKLQKVAVKCDASLNVSSCIEKTEFIGKIATAECMECENNDVFTIIDKDQVEYFACVKNLQWNLCVGDKVKVLAERDDNNELVVVGVEPKRKRDFEFGRLTAISFEKGYAIFEDNTLLLFSVIKDIKFPLQIHEEYKFEAIESDKKFDAKIFDYRVLSVLEKVQSKVSVKGISIQSEPFKIFYNPQKKYISRFIKVLNRSDRAVDLLTIEAISLTHEGSKLVEFDMKDREINYNIIARNGNFKIYFRIFPLEAGTFEYKLIAKFKDFEEVHKFTIEISKSYLICAPRMKSKPRFVDIKLEEYLVPEDLKEIDYTKVHSATEELQIRFSFLNEVVNAENYLDKMRLGIYLEEIAIEKAFANYRMEQTTFETKGELLRLICKDVAEKRPSITVGDKVIATDPFRTDNERPVFEGIIQKVENESILCKFHHDFHSTHHDKTYTIDFNFSRSTYKKQHHALERVMEPNGLGYNFLFPSKISSKSPQVDAKIDEKGNLIINDYPRNWCNNLLNEHQKNAVVNVLRGENRPLPYVFFGCPGSGKTQTIVETILQIHIHMKSSRIIVATPSNSAANSITEMLIQSNKFCSVNPKFIRLVGFNLMEKDLIPENLMKYCATVSVASDGKQTNLKFERNERGVLSNITRNKILEYRILIATLNCFGSLLQMKFNSKFSHVFIDEAGQSVEPETLIPLTLLDPIDGQCVLAGDPNQLGPMLTSRYGKIFKYNSSMMERLLLSHPFYKKNYGDKCDEYDPQFVTKLKINYRALPSLLKVYNDLFYNSELESGVDEKLSLEASMMSNADSFLWKHTNKKCSVFFVNVNNGKNRKIQDSCSWFNEEEIRAIMSFLQKCSSSQVPFKEIGIVTPYSLQVKKLKHQVAVGTSETDLKIGTVEEFQGQERLIILVSTVRTEERQINFDQKFGLGFLQCPKRMNVAISRAKALLVVFGKEAILKKDENWNFLIDYAKKNHTYVSDNY